MCLRIFSACFLVLSLAACKAKPSEPIEPTEKAEHIGCALDHAQQFANDCTLERLPGELIVHRPDGGFRRLAMLPDGRGLAASDGNETAVLSLDKAVLEVVLGDDRYRIPVAVQSHGKP